MCVEKLHTNETREQCYDLRQKQVIRATGLSKQCTDTYRDSHDADRHKLRRNTGVQHSAISPAISFAITLELFSQDSQCDPTAEPHSNICCESVFALIPDHEVRAAKLTNRWISGSWWGRDASSDEHLVGTKHGLLKCRSVRKKPPGKQWSRRETIEARGTKWNFDVGMDSGIPEPNLEPRRDVRMPTTTAPMEIPTVSPPALPPEEYVPEIVVHSNSGGGDVAAKMKMVICGSSYADPTKTKVIDRVVRYTNILGAPISYLPNEDGELIDTGQIIIAQKLFEFKNDIYVMMVSWRHCVTSKDGYTLICAKPATLEKIWTRITKLAVIKRGAALNPQVPVTYLGFEYRSVHDGERRDSQ